MKNSIVMKLAQKSSTLLFLPVVLLISACSTVYTPETDHNTSYDFASIKTYHIVGDKALRNPMLSDMDRLRLGRAIDSSMQQRGKLEAAEQQADVLVSYFVVTKDKIKVNSTYSGGYYGGYYRGSHGGSGYGAGVSNVSVRDYVEGTLVLDIIDNKTKLSVFRSTLTKPIKSHETVEEREQAINKVVDDMMLEMPSS